MIDWILPGAADQYAPECTPAIQKTGNGSIFVFNRTTKHFSLQDILKASDTKLFVYNNLVERFIGSNETALSFCTTLRG